MMLGFDTDMCHPQPLGNTHKKKKARVLGLCVTFSDCAINVKTRTKAEAVVHITSPATKSDALTYQAVFAV